MGGARPAVADHLDKAPAAEPVEERGAVLSTVGLEVAAAGSPRTQMIMSTASAASERVATSSTWETARTASSHPGNGAIRVTLHELFSGS